MTLHTGGSAFGAISTKSMFCSFAMRNASRRPKRPSCEPSDPIKRHVRDVISSFMRGPSFLAIFYTFPSLRRERRPHCGKPHKKTSRHKKPEETYFAVSERALCSMLVLRLTRQQLVALRRWGCISRFTQWCIVPFCTNIYK